MSTFDSTFDSTFTSEAQSGPSGVYASSSVAVTPNSSLTDFTFIVDLSNLPQSWWDEVNTSDPTKGRVTKDDGTELAADWIDFDDVTQTGEVRILWTGTVNGTETVRIYTPDSGKTSYLATDTYGAYNAYDDDWYLYHPSGGGDNRIDGSTPSTEGGVTVGGATGPNGEKATTFDGTDDSVYGTLSHDFDNAKGTSLFGLVKAPASGDHARIINVGDISVGTEYFAIDLQTGTDFFYWARAIDTSGEQSQVAYTASPPVADTWYTIGGVSHSFSDHRLYVDGVEVATDSTDIIDQATLTGYGIGKLERTSDVYGSGTVAHIQFHTIARSSAWADFESQQTLDNSTFWGTWSVESPTQESSGGSNASMLLSSSGVGEKSIEDGSDASMLVNSEGVGNKSVESGSDATIALSTTSGGSKATEDGSDASMLVNSTGEGEKQVEQGSDASILIEATGGGLDLSPPVVTDDQFTNVNNTPPTDPTSRYEILEQNTNADSYDVRFNGEIINKPTNTTWFIDSSDFQNGFSHDSAFDVEFRTVVGSDKGPWGPLVTLYSSPEIPEAVDLASYSGELKTDGIIISYTPTTLQDGYILFTKRVSDDVTVDIITKGPVSSGELSPIEISGLSSNTEYYYILKPRNFSSHYPTGFYENNTENPVNFTTLQALSGGSSASLLVQEEGEGKKDVGSGSDSAIIISAVGVGQAGTFIGGGSNATMLIDTTGEGSKAVSDGQGTSIVINESGTGQKGVIEGSDASLLVNSVGSGRKDIQSGSDSVVLVASDGQGNKQILSGAQAEVIIEAFGSGALSQEVEIAKINMKLKQAGIKGIFEV